jgi:hypothetical protein
MDAATQTLTWTSMAAKASRAAALLGMACAAQAQGTAASGAQVFRCPGPPVLYTDALSAQEARDRGCRTIEGAPITIVQSVRPRPAPPAASGATVAAASRPADARIDPAAQRARDADARRILGEELRKEEERLAELQKDYNNGEPERRGRRTQLPALPGPRGRDEGRHHAQGSRHRGAEARAGQAAPDRALHDAGAIVRRIRGLRPPGHPGGRGARRRPLPAGQRDAGERHGLAPRSLLRGNVRDWLVDPAPLATPCAWSGNEVASGRFDALLRRAPAGRHDRARRCT